MGTVNYAVEAKTAEDSVNGKGVDEEVQRYLEVVAMSRVFDVEGLWEVLGEVGRDSDWDEERLSEEQPEDGMEIIIIDNMTNLINELFARKERSEGTLRPLPPHMSTHPYPFQAPRTNTCKHTPSSQPSPAPSTSLHTPETSLPFSTTPP